MFGIPPRTDPHKDAERQAIERAMRTVDEELNSMQGASPAEAERSHQRIKDRCTDRCLPLDFKRRSLDRARAYECNANMRATDRLLHDAMHMAVSEHMKERGQKLSEARKFFSKACSLGAGDEFRHASQRLMDTIMMSGGIHHAGPSRAKPLDTAPKTPNRAKA